MGSLPIKGIISNAASGNAADGQVMQTPWDNALGPMASHLLAYLRAGRTNPTASTIVDALGNPVQVTGNAGFTRNLADANFNGDASITYNTHVSNAYQYPGNGLGPTNPTGPMTASFTMLASWRTPATFDAADNVGGDSSGLGFYVDTNGAVHFGVNFAIGSDGASSSGFLAASTTYVLWWSYDSATRIHRIGYNTPTILEQVTGSQTHSPSAATQLYPFGYYASGYGSGSWNRWMCFNKAYLNGVNANDDQAFTNMLSAAYAQVG